MNFGSKKTVKGPRNLPVLLELHSFERMCTDAFELKASPKQNFCMDAISLTCTKVNVQ